MQQAVNDAALRAKDDERAREELIQANEQTILRTASTVSRRYVSRSDDEWSVALCAFNRAIDRYDGSKGDFLPFAQMLIRRELVDAWRQESKHAAELSVAPEVFDGTAEDEDDDNSPVDVSANVVDIYLEKNIITLLGNVIVDKKGTKITATRWRSS
jgi:RNA polymerase sigma factor